MQPGPLIFALALAAASSAAAQLPDKALLADSNGDGKVSLAEYQTSRREFIMQDDTSRDGKVSAAEWKLAVDRLATALDTADGYVLTTNQANGFAWIDADKDGFTTPAEIDAWTAARFPKLDLDKDGFVTKAEARKIQEAAAKKG